MRRLRCLPPLRPSVSPMSRPSGISGMSPSQRRASHAGAGSPEGLPISRLIHKVAGATAQEDGKVGSGELCGWVRRVRKTSAARFFDVVDGSSFRRVQAVLPRLAGADKEAAGWLERTIQVGAAVRLEGDYHYARRTLSPDGEASNGGNQLSMQVTRAEVVGSSEPSSIPFQAKYNTTSILRKIPQFRTRHPVYSATLRLRSDAIAILTSFFNDRAFVQTHPPVITSSDCEGGGDVFSVVAGHRATSTASEPDPSFFGKPKYLTVSSQLQLEALAQSVGAVWVLAPAFRAERSSTTRHLSEFYMLEAEMAFVDRLDAVMDTVETMLQTMARGLLDRGAEKDWVEREWERDDVEAAMVEAGDISSRVEASRRWRGLAQTQQQRRWPRITYTDALALLADDAELPSGLKPPEWGEPLHVDHERRIAHIVGGKDADDAGYLPVFVTHYPRRLKPFYMLPSSPQQSSKSESRPVGVGETAECFDLLVPDVGELVGGSLREHRHAELCEAMKGAGVADGELDWYLDLRKWGCPPHGGFGLGFDRLLAYLTTFSSVRDVVTFPRWYGNCRC